MPRGVGGSTTSFRPIEQLSIADAKNVWLVTGRSELLSLKEDTASARSFLGEVAAIDFVHRDRGWLLLRSGQLLTTINGGKNWQEIGVLRRNWSFFPDARMKFASESVGWIIARESVFRTEDGGKSWKNFDVPQNETASEMVVVSSDEFWAVTWTASVFFTQDGGLTWTISDVPGRNPVESYPRTIARDPKGRIWIGNLSSSSSILVTDDGGKTWKTGLFPAETGTIRLESMQFTLNGIGRIVYRRIIETDQPIHSYVLATTDYGQTWKPVTTSGLTFEPLKVFFLDASVGFLIGEADIARTKDGGANWKVIYSSYEDPLNKP